MTDVAFSGLSSPSMRAGEHIDVPPHLAHPERRALFSHPGIRSVVARLHRSASAINLTPAALDGARDGAAGEV